MIEKANYVVCHTKGAHQYTKNVQKDNGDDRDVKFHDFKGCLISQILISCKRCLKLRKTSIWSKVMERIF